MFGPIEPRALLAVGPSSHALATVYKLARVDNVLPLSVFTNQKELKYMFDGPAGHQVVLLYDEVRQESTLRFDGDHEIPSELDFLPRYCVGVPMHMNHEEAGEWRENAAERLLKIFHSENVQKCLESGCMPWGTTLPKQIIKKAEQLQTDIPSWAYRSTIQQRVSVK